MPIRLSKTTKIHLQGPSLGTKTLNVPQIKQEQTQWCWAGCADMVLHYYGNSGAKQCEFANFLFSQSSCCQTPSGSNCNKPCQVPDVKKVFNKWGIKSSSKSGTVPFSVLRTQIDLGMPVEVAYAWSGGGGHVAIVRGWGKNDKGNFVRVNDPAYGSGGVYYSDLLKAYGKGTWFHTWTNIEK